jgi:hypothetical protein
MTVRHIFEISEEDHPRLVTHARDIWWTLDFANAFVSPGVNSRGGLVPSHGASRRRLGDKGIKGVYWSWNINLILTQAAYSQCLYIIYDINSFCFYILLATNAWPCIN